ncbi:MAG: DUF2191 domain-containing protein [Geminicoccaceae bacterium]
MSSRGFAKGACARPVMPLDASSIVIAYDPSMRTTLTIDERIAKALEDLAYRSGRSFEEVVDETLRAGLAAKGAGKARPYVVRPAALGGPMPGISLDKALALADAIEDQERAAKMKR